MPGIYIHIPFCLKKCGYCDFFSEARDRNDVPEKAYLAAICGQLKRDAELFCEKDRRVGTIYFGGGTPSVMPPDFFGAVLSEISKRFAVEKNAEVSAEINPATADMAWFRSARAAGITRASIGVQSFNPRLLESLGRIHSAKDAMRSVAEAEDAGFESVGIDLMYAIGDETVSELEDDIRAAMTFQPGHISAYQLTIETAPSPQPFSEVGLSSPHVVSGDPACLNRVVKKELTGFPTYTLGNDNSAAPSRREGERWRMNAPTEDAQLKQMRIAARMFERGGWKRYEISNFARPGFECRHNLNYWRYGEYLGLGAGAASFAKAQTSFARRWTQIRDIEKYISGSREFAEDEEIGKETAMGEFCFMGLRTAEGISRANFKEMFEADFDNIYKSECVALIKDGMLSDNGDRLALTQKGMELSNQVFQKFLR